ncbi:sigma factor-like helix-turn-helix DNA-binding protein [Candidatus Latescibacterota bacterium]
MTKTYNQSKELLARRRSYNPLFWEVPVEQDVLDQVSLEDGLYYESPEEAQARTDLRPWALDVMPVIQRLMDEVLTARQREIVELYFLESRTEQEIAQHLGISKATVSQHLFGKRRQGGSVGGAIPKLQKELAAAGILGKAQ